MSNKFAERLFQFFAAALIGSAVYSYLNGHMNRVFVATVVGSLCFFVSIRFQVKERLQVRNENRRRELDENRAAFQSADVAFEEKASEPDNFG